MKDDNFVSLLYYYGMLTITGIRGELLKLSIPNNNVRIQYYQYVTEMYDSLAELNIGTLKNAYADAAYDGLWQPLLEQIAHAYTRVASIRNDIEGERTIQGFLMAYLSLSSYYLMAPEMELSHGYGDIFLMPDRYRYPDIGHSFIIELKYLNANATEAEASAQLQQAREQLERYAADAKVRLMTHATTLHLITMQFRQHQLISMSEA